MSFVRCWLRAMLRRWRAFRVSGNSMSPTLLPGDWVWVDPESYRRESPGTEHVVVVCHPYRRDIRIVKRVGAAVEDGKVELRGDNPAESTDSEVFGSVPAFLVIGRVRLGYRTRTRSTLHFTD